jgi:RNA polymerase sigma factor (sigma-70 family)
MDEDDAYRELWPLLFSIAYRMVGSVSEAEDLVQEAFQRFHRAVSGGEEVASPKAYLSAVTTRRAIDHLRSARARRERYVGAWLPEPLVTSQEPDAADHAETADSLSLAFLVLLERLSPVQRAVFLLHDVFGYGYAEIAELVGLLAADAVLYGDGAGKAPALAAPSTAPSGWPGSCSAWPAAAPPPASADARIQTLRSIINPDKLRHLGPVGDAAALLGNG